MRTEPRRTRGLAIAFTLLLAAIAALAAERVAPGTKTLATPSEIKWEPFAVLPGGQQAPLWGNPKTGEHGILYRWPAGAATPLHTHSNSEHAVVLSGTLTLAVDGGAAKSLPAGSYFSMFGGTKHATTCAAGSDCVFFLHREGPFDVVMAENKASLDGRTFVGQLGPAGKSKGDADNFVFVDGQFRSTACDAYGFGAAAYRATRVGGDLSFESTTESRKEGTMAWKGTVSGNSVSGTVVWTRAGKAPVEYWFKGTAS